MRSGAGNNRDTRACFTYFHSKGERYSLQCRLRGGEGGIRTLDLDPVLKAVFRSEGPPSSAGFHFSLDGKSIAFVIEEAGVDNIWMQPVDGSKGRKLTNLNDSESIQDFRWSLDGKALALLRFSSVSDVILLRDTGASKVTP
jgi:WD40-like Beta Propeller Repeat